MRNKSAIEENKNTCRKNCSTDSNNKIEDDISNIDIKNFFDNKM